MRIDPPGETHAVFGPQNYEHLNTFNDKGKTRIVSFWPNADSVLGELRRLCKEITRAHPWDIDEATWFVLTGEVPVVRPVKSTALMSGLPSARAHSTISLTIQPWVPPETVKLVYQQAQKQVIGGKPGRISDKNLNLLRFVVDRADRNGNLPRGEVLVKEWDRNCKRERRPGWCYGADTRRFFRDFRSVQKSVTDSERAGIVQEWWPQ
jgi:hypothetical protein